jgi:hypothetical protein
MPDLQKVPPTAISPSPFRVWKAFDPVKLRELDRLPTLDLDLQEYARP